MGGYMLIAIPQRARWITHEMDGTLWAYRYNPYENDKSDGNIIGKTDNISFPKKIDLPPVVKDYTRFINETMDILTKENLPYKTLILENILQGEK